MRRSCSDIRTSRSRVRTCQTITLHFLPQRRARNAERLCRGEDGAAGHCQRPLNVALLGIFARRAERSDEVAFDAQDGSLRSGNRSPGMIQRPIARATARSTRFLSSRTLPGQPCSRAASKASADTPTASLSYHAGKLGKAAVDQPLDVIDAIAQRRDLVCDDVDPVVEIVTEGPCANALAAGRRWSRTPVAP